MAKLVMQIKLTGDYALHVFKDNKNKLIEISLGSDEKAAFQKARDLKEAFGAADDIIDQTK